MCSFVQSLHFVRQPKTKTCFSRTPWNNWIFFSWYFSHYKHPAQANLIFVCPSETNMKNITSLFNKIIHNLWRQSGFRPLTLQLSTPDLHTCQFSLLPLCLPRHALFLFSHCMPADIGPRELNNLYHAGNDKQSLFSFFLTLCDDLCIIWIGWCGATLSKQPHGMHTGSWQQTCSLGGLVNNQLVAENATNTLKYLHFKTRLITRKINYFILVFGDLMNWIVR